MDLIEVLKTIASIVILPLMLLAGQRWLNGKFDANDRARERKDAAQAERHEAEAAWRESVTEHMKIQDRKTDMLMVAWATTMRSDLIHRAHRYIDDLHAASVEEKEAYHAQWEDYQKFCEENNITNNFIDNLMIAVMNLPTRDVSDEDVVENPLKKVPSLAV